MQTSQEIFFEHERAKIYYDKDLDTLFLEYISKVRNHEEFLEINKPLIDAFLQLNTKKFVADIRLMGVIAIESQQWVADHLLPSMMGHLKGEILYHAQLLDEEDIFAVVSGNGVKAKSEENIEGLVVEQFSNYDELVKKLKEVE